jgi:hypothetical protein
MGISRRYFSEKWNNIPVPFIKREVLQDEIAAMFSLALLQAGKQRMEHGRRAHSCAGALLRLISTVNQATAQRKGKNSGKIIKPPEIITRLNPQLCWGE